MFPSRGRPESAARAIASLRDNATSPADISYLVALDPDDAADYGPLYGADDLTIWTAPRRYGYQGIHHYWNHLATLATGDWLMIWNDDYLMQTPGWDGIVHAQQPGVLWPYANHAPQCNLAPTWPRSWTEAIGHVSCTVQTDTWMEQTAALIGRIWHVPIQIIHDRADVTGNHNDATADEGWRQAYGPAYRFWDPQFVEQRYKDADVLRRLLDAQGIPHT